MRKSARNAQMSATPSAGSAAVRRPGAATAARTSLIGQHQRDGWRKADPHGVPRREDLVMPRVTDVDRQDETRRGPDLVAQRAPEIGGQPHAARHDIAAGALETEVFWPD